jgi:PAS domain S-box-containing protein
MDSFDFLKNNPHLKQILMNSKLPDIIPGGFSIATNATCERIIHNPVTAKFLRIEPWGQLSFSSSQPLTMKAYQNSKLLPASEMPIQQAAWYGKESIGCEIEFVWEDGVSKIARWNAIPLRDENGIICGSIATMDDITEVVHLARELEIHKKNLEKEIAERKRIEKEFGESEKRYRELVKHAPAGIFEVDFRNKRFLSVNNYMSQMSGYSKEELLEMTPFDILDDQSKMTFQTRISQWLKGEKPDQVVEYKVKAKDGREIYASLDVTCTLDENGKPLGATVVGHDVTERKLMEKALLEATSKAEYNQLILEAVIQQMPVGIIITDASGSAARNNEAMDKIWRRKMHYTENIANHGYVANHPDGRQYELAEWPLTRSLQKEEKVICEEMVILRGDGTKGYIYASSTPVKDQNGQIIAGVVIDVDITELKKADQNKNRFLNNLSHELRNPLASMMMSLSLLKRVAPDSEQAWQAKEILERQTIQLSCLVDDLLEVTRISQNKIVLKNELVELNNLVSRTVADYTTMFIEKEVSLEAVIYPQPIYLQADPTRLTQVIGNLLHNALKFTEKDGKTQVIVSKNESNNEAIVEVIDNGLGIKPQLLPNLFQPFMQAESSLDHNRGGLGLGLAIVKGLVDLHSGSVTANSQGLGKGTQFAIRLPLLSDKDGEHEKQLQEERKILRSLRIMVIDDIPDVVKILCSLLQLLGHEVTSAGNGPEGLAKAVKFAPEVIICDIGLPGMNGYEVARNIRNDQRHEKTFLIALSGYAQADDLATAIESGFNRHLAKPVDLDALEKILAEVP